MSRVLCLSGFEQTFTRCMHTYIHRYNECTHEQTQSRVLSTCEPCDVCASVHVYSLVSSLLPISQLEHGLCADTTHTHTHNQEC